MNSFSKMYKCKQIPDKGAALSVFSAQFSMNRCLGNLIYCQPPEPSKSTTTQTTPTMVVMGSEDKIEDKSYSIFNYHPVQHSAISAGFVVLVLFLLLCLWFCCKSLGISGIKKFRKAAFTKQPDVIKEANEIEMGRMSQTVTTPSNVWEQAKLGVPQAPPLPSMGFGMPQPLTSQWNSSVPSVPSLAPPSVNSEVIDKLDSVLQESRETQRNLYRTMAKLEAEK